MGAQPTPAAPPTPRPTLGRNVVALAAVSFLTDVSSEMIYPLLPVFLTTVLGASAVHVGLIEGAAESTASLLKLASGWWSDRVRRRKPLVMLGYALATAARPLVAIATTAGQVMAVRLADRVGKGIRSSPRDALIADSVDPAVRGRAFGVHRAADHAGAVLGPLIAFALLRWGDVPLRTVFWLAAVPGALALVALAVGVRERLARPASEPASTPPRLDVAMGRPFWGVMAAVLVFTLGNSTDAFLLLRAQSLGVPTALLPILWAFLHVVKSATSAPGGALSDRIGRRPTLLAGWIVYAVVYAGFAVAAEPWHAWALFALYGLFFGLTEGTERALVADLAPPARRGSAYGWFHLTVGVGALPASVLFGLIWTRGGPAAAFLTGAGLALGAAALLTLALPRRSATR